VDVLCRRRIACLAHFRVLHHDATAHSRTTSLDVQATVYYLEAHIRDSHATGEVRTTLPNVEACRFDDEATSDVHPVSLDLQRARQACRPG
jgi:hypothetical protein